MVDPIARVIAIVGLALSAVKIIYDWWRDRRRVRIIVDQAKVLGATAMSVSIVNIGRRPTTVEGLGIFLDNGRVLGVGHIKDKKGKAASVTYGAQLSSHDLGKPIGDGEPANLYFALDTLDALYAEGNHIVSIVAWDAEGHEYKGKIPRYLKRRLRDGPRQLSSDAD